MSHNLKLDPNDSDSGSALPDGWNIRPFDECVTTEGLEHRKSVPRSAYGPKGRYPVVDQGQLPIAGFTDDERVVHQNDIPLVLFGDHTRTVKYLDFPFAAGADGTKLIRAKEGVTDPLFLYYALRNIELPSRGYNRHFALLREQAVMVPSDLREQRAVAGVLSKLHVAVEVQDRIVATLKELKAATMAKLFREGLRGEPLKQTEIGEIPESWKVVAVGDLFEIQLGKMLSQKARQGPSPKPYLRNANVQWGRFDLSDVFRMDFSEPEVRKFRLRVRDVLVCEGGEVGRAAMWGGEIDECFYQKALHRLRPRLPETVLPAYYVYWAVAAFTLFRTHGPTGTETTIAHLPAVKLAGLPMALPPFEEQHDLVRIMDSIEGSLRRAERRCRASESLFASMLRVLTAGRLRLRHPFTTSSDLIIAGKSE